MRDGQPPFGSLAEVRAHFLKGLALRVTTWERGDGGGVTARLRLRPDNCGEDNRNIDKNRGPELRVWLIVVFSPISL